MKKIKDSNIVIRVNQNTKEKAQKVVENYGLTLSTILNAFVENIAENENIPFSFIKKNSSYLQKKPLNIENLKKSLNCILKKMEKNSIEKLTLFGSVARGEQNDESDIDIKITTGKDFSLRDLGLLTSSLKEEYDRRVDITFDNPDGSKFLDLIKKDEVVLYESR